MNTRKEIEKEMIESKIRECLDEDVDYLEHWETGFDVKPSANSHFRVKISHIIDSNKLHMQFGTNDITGLHKKMQAELVSPYVLLSGKAQRPYGLAFDIIVKGNSIDGHQLRELGHKVRDANVAIASLAQAADYCMMDFCGIEDGEDNEGHECKMLVFELAPECRLYIKFSDIEPIVHDDTKTLPEYRAEWLMAWLCANYLTQEEE